MKTNCIDQLRTLGITADDASALRRISMTLNRWFELECGDAQGRAIERDETTGKPYWTYDLGQNGKRGRSPLADRERGAEKRLAAIMARYPSLQSYIQGDCRGASLYILRPGDVPEGQNAESYYSRGIAVYK